jgi:hypothetical protein
MKTLTEVKKAVRQMAPKDKAALTLWLNTQFDDQMSEAEERRMLAAIDKGIRSLKEHGGVSIEEVRKMIPSWATR